MSDPDSLRVFLAIELTPTVRAALARAQEKLRRTGARVTWTAEANLHLTLFFLGTITRSRLERDCAMADALATALFVMGPDDGLQWAKDYPDVDVIYATESGLRASFPLDQ